MKLLNFLALTLFSIFMSNCGTYNEVDRKIVSQINSKLDSLSVVIKNPNTNPMGTPAVLLKEKITANKNSLDLGVEKAYSFMVPLAGDGQDIANLKVTLSAGGDRDGMTSFSDVFNTDQWYTTGDPQVHYNFEIRQNSQKRTKIYILTK